MILKQLEIGPMGNFAYIVGDGTLCAVIDPGWEADKILKKAESKNLKITHILLTHTHFDHASAAASLAKKTGAAVFVHTAEAGGVSAENVVKFTDGETISVGRLEFRCLHTPGHTPGSTCFLADKMLFTGDTLFVDGIGRTDLEGSNEYEMTESLKRLCMLPDNIIVYPGHNYGAEPASTIGEQKRRNPYFRI